MILSKKKGFITMSCIILSYCLTMAFSVLDLAVANDYSSYSISSYDRRYIDMEEALSNMETIANMPTDNYKDFESFVAYFGRSKDLKLKNGKYILEYDRRYKIADGTYRYRFYFGENLGGVYRYHLVEVENAGKIKLILRGL